jgi:YD repeat-containing protein
LTEDDSYTYAYDSKGNRVSRTSKTSGAVETYTYDSQNRLVGYANPTTTASYAYDALDRRVAKTVDGSTEACVYDPWALDTGNPPRK